MKQSRYSAFTLVELLVVIAIIGILIAMLLPAVQATRECARRAQCENNLRQIGLALHQYEQAHEFLPAGVVNPEGPVLNYPKGNHIGWMVHLLPYIEESAVYGQIDQAAGVYDPKNRAARCAGIPMFQCPSCPDRLICVDDYCYGDWSMSNPSGQDDEEGEKKETPKLPEGERGSRVLTNYAGCVGDEDVPIDEGNHGVLVLNRNIRLDEITDGLRHTIFVGEKRPDDFDLGWMSGSCATLRTTGVPWYHGWRQESPLKEVVAKRDKQKKDSDKYKDKSATYIAPSELEDPEVLAALKKVGGFGSYHPSISNFLFGDGTVRPIDESVDARVFQCLGNRSDGDLLLKSPTRESD